MFLKLSGNSFRDYDPVQFSQSMKVAQRIQIDERPRIEDRRLARFAAHLPQLPNRSA